MNKPAAKTLWQFVIGALMARCLATLPAFAGESAGMSPEKWSEDLRFLVSELPRRHKNAFHTVSRSAFEKASAELATELPALPEPEIIVRMQELVASVGDAHTCLTTFPPKDFHRYPLSFSWFGPELRVTRTIAAYRDALGARLVRVGDLDVNEVMTRVNKLVPHENYSWVRAIGPGCLPYPEVMRALKILREPDHGLWTFEGALGKTISLEIASLGPDEKPAWLSTWKEAPLYRQKPSEPLWCSLLSDSETLYVNFRSYPDNAEFKRRAKEVFEQLDRLKPKRVVIDLRYNTGGDFYKGRSFLVSGLQARRASFPAGGLFVITGKATQSAAVVNAIDFRKDLGATLVGEPTGARPNGYSEAGRFRLPNSNMEVSCSTRYYKFQDHDTEAVLPDMLIEPAWETYAQGRDTAMEWILLQPVARRL